MKHKYIYSFRRFLGLGVLFCMISLFSSCNNELNGEFSKNDSLRKRFIDGVINSTGENTVQFAATFTGKRYEIKDLQKRWRSNTIEFAENLHKNDVTNAFSIVYKRYTIKNEEVVEEDMQKETIVQNGMEGLAREVHALYLSAYDAGKKADTFFKKAKYSLIPGAAPFQFEKDGNMTLLTEVTINDAIAECKRLFLIFKREVKNLSNLCKALLKSSTGDTDAMATILPLNIKKLTKLIDSLSQEYENTVKELKERTEELFGAPESNHKDSTFKPTDASTVTTITTDDDEDWLDY